MFLHEYKHKSESGFVHVATWYLGKLSMYSKEKNKKTKKLADINPIRNIFEITLGYFSK